MKIAILYSPWLLSFRKSFDPSTLRTDPRGLTGSELGFWRIADELARAGHEVHLYSVFDVLVPPGTLWASGDVSPGFLHSWKGDPPVITDCDVCISVNCPDELRNCSGFRVCLFWLNDVSFCKAGFEKYVDLWLSCSEPHMRQVFNNPEWRKVEVTPDFPNGRAQYEPDASRWAVVGLGCDPDRYPKLDKIPGRVVYCSSPDRGLHWVLQEWPAIKRAVPHATLKVFYRLRAWIDGFEQTAYYPPIEPLRARALYIEECLRRMQGPEWGIEICDSVCREQIEREMSLAEVLGYPCDTTTWSEGFSCTTLEACAAGAIPIIWDTDALGEIYRGSGATIIPRHDLAAWRKAVVRTLHEVDDSVRRLQRAMTLGFASEHTWCHTTEQILEQITQRRRVAA